MGVRKTTSEQSSFWHMVNHGFSKTSNAFLCLHRIPRVKIECFCPYAMCNFTIVLTYRLCIPATSFVLALAAMSLYCENAAFFFFWLCGISIQFSIISECEYSTLLGLLLIVKCTTSWVGKKRMCLSIP